MKVHPNNDPMLDRCEAAYRAEYERWCVRRVRADDSHNYDRFHLVRNASPNRDLITDQQEIVKLAKHEAKSYSDAESWLNTYHAYPVPTHKR
jgi:hypothetical protein